jgi:precorrin-2 dehydrogenase / sirohydrochlorin ferrochelatase
VTQYYPIFLQVSGKRCVVVGGGQVAARKVISLLENQAQVEVISPEICPELNRLGQEGKVQLTPRPYQQGDLAGALVVIAATDDQEVNTRISKEAQELGVLVNVVDDAKKSNFIVPACLHRGDLNIAISTSGRSPALARRLRRKLEEEIGEEYTFLALIVSEVREELKRRGIKVSRNAWQKALDLDKLIELIKRGEIGAATRTVLDYLLEQQTRITAASIMPAAFKMPVEN